MMNMMKNMMSNYHCLKSANLTVLHKKKLDLIIIEEYNGFQANDDKTVLNAFYIMREAMLVGSILSIRESWTNMIQQDLNKLQEPYIILLNKILSKI